MQRRLPQARFFFRSSNRAGPAGPQSYEHTHSTFFLPTPVMGFTPLLRHDVRENEAVNVGETRSE